MGTVEGRVQSYHYEMRTEEVGVKIKPTDILRVDMAIIVRYYNHHLHAIQTSTLLKTSTPISSLEFDGGSESVDSEGKELPLNLDIIVDVVADVECDKEEEEEEVEEEVETNVETEEETEEEMKHYAATIPASAEAIDSLKTLSISPLLKMETEKCSICLENIGFRENEENVKLSSLSCEHVFHHLCIVKWLQTSYTCPLCRYPMLVRHN
ncbi:E3 ubiquitin-protein ligase At1g12760-like [Phaseolus vulgaris]|uniref:E3 ubiquitin-protein ligase At1g12760-like n=1 Tax=Phaseolus vulgaris TaxID=3885 RepID=UPI0035CBD870